ncbi:hypothetical protein D910_00904, partial [Dendroctonus ponderosae]
MKNCPREERIDMIFTLGEFPERKHPKPTVFKRFYTNLRKAEVSIIKNPLQGNLSLKMKKTFSRYLIQLSKILIIIKKHNFYPYKIQLCHELDGNDFENRTEFCMWVLDEVAENEKFFENVLFNDECTFHNNVLVNRHNFHYYSDTNPRVYRIMKNQNRWPVNVWGGILGQYLSGPNFFEGHLNVSNKPSLNIIGKKKSLSILEPTCGINWMELRVISTAKWIGRNGFRNWPPTSPDLTPLDFFLWGYIKGIVYHTLPTTSHDMKTRIRDAFKT